MAMHGTFVLAVLCVDLVACPGTVDDEWLCLGCMLQSELAYMRLSALAA